VNTCHSIRKRWQRDEPPWGTTIYDERRDDTTTASNMESEGVYHLLERDTSTQLGIFRMLLWFANSNAIPTTPLYPMPKMTNNVQRKRLEDITIIPYQCFKPFLPIISRNAFDPQSCRILIHLIPVLPSLHPMQSQAHIVLLLYDLCEFTLQTLYCPLHLFSSPQVECSRARLGTTAQLLDQLGDIAFSQCIFLHACFER
jgi:hypothetical protein